MPANHRLSRLDVARYLLESAILSLIVNALALVPAVYLLQIYGGQQWASRVWQGQAMTWKPGGHHDASVVLRVSASGMPDDPPPRC